MRTNICHVHPELLAQCLPEVGEVGQVVSVDRHPDLVMVSQLEQVDAGPAEVLTPESQLGEGVT